MSDSVFTKIIKREVPANILYEDDRVIAFYDINPVQEGHFLVVPKTPEPNILENSDEDFLYTMSIARELAAMYIKENNCTGFKIVINSGSSAGQVVFHTHVHVIPYK
ncbi:histidine triad protein HinT [Mycoplasmopsis edwardii]|uniref:HIT domain-containing protein n=1 Tax=Mycoplasmopsis edwardii TaxID=53558 RepID=A0ACD4PHM5_9BACT|nr:HIT domain-containing protein [Mycoplasmopsis edwardii]WBP84006.1 HIT domain-containing protein [Mycoplasmopsis edwardii]